MNLFHEERAINLARQEVINARLDALVNDFEISKVDSYSNENTSQNRGWKEKIKLLEGQDQK